MPRDLKVYAWHNSKRGPDGKRAWTREIMAAASVAEVLRETGMSRGDFAWGGSLTGVPAEREQALAHPHQAFWRPEGVPAADAGPWRPFGASTPRES